MDHDEVGLATEALFADTLVSKCPTLCDVPENARKKLERAAVDAIGHVTRTPGAVVRVTCDSAPEVWFISALFEGLSKRPFACGVALRKELSHQARFEFSNNSVIYLRLQGRP